MSDGAGNSTLIEVKTVHLGNTRTGNDLISVYRYQYSNHLGSASLELNENQDLISYEEYYPFGSTSYQMHTNDTEVSQKRYRYCGKEKDNESGLYYYGARYYADWLCKFTAVDPRKDQYPFQNSYAYAANNPITFTDVNGEGPGDTTHTVQAGDTYSSLASQYGVSVNQLREWNGFEDTKIPIGANLVVADPFSGTTTNNEPTINLFDEAPSLGGASGPNLASAALMTSTTASTARQLSTLAIDPKGKLIETAKPGPSGGFALRALGLTVSFLLSSFEAGRGSNVTNYPYPLLPQTFHLPKPKDQLDKLKLYSLGYPVIDEPEDPNYEYFYRAMSINEFKKNFGTLQQKVEDGVPKGDGLWITNRLHYLFNEKSFIYKGNNAKKYDIIVRYKVPEGTTDYLDSVSISQDENNAATTIQARNENRPLKKQDKKGHNFGFPGAQTGNLHFNNRIISISIHFIPKRK